MHTAIDLPECLSRAMGLLIVAFACEKLFELFIFWVIYDIFHVGTDVIVIFSVFFLRVDEQSSEM